MTAAQKGLMIIAIVYLMAGVLLLLSSLSLLDPSSRSGAAGQQAPVLTLLGLSPGADTDARQPSVAQASQVTPAFVLYLDLGLFTLLAGICGIRAATDVERIVPYLLLSCALFLTWNAPQGEWGYILPLRGAKLAALLLVAYSVGVSTLLFQTLTNNPILTPSVLGFDALYVFLQTLLVFALGSTGYTQLPPYGKFALELAAMLGGSLLLFSLLLRQGGRDLARMILIGVIFGVLFRSLSSLLQRMIDPEEYAVAQTAMFASFNTVNTKLLGFGGAIAVASMPVLWRERHRLDVHLLGRDQVTNLGISYPRHTLWILAWIALLVATATATVGIVSFFGLLVCALANHFSGSLHHAVRLPMVFLVSAVMLIGGQAVFEHLLGMKAVLSVVVEFAGGLVFLWLVLKKRAV